MSNIEWTGETWNPVVGCTRASAGCDNCYAVTMTKRLEAMGQKKYAGLVNHGKNHFNGVVRGVKEDLPIPFKWKKPRVVFVNSMSDLFHPGISFEFVDKVFAIMALTPWHTYQILTKRPGRMAEYLSRGNPATHIKGPPYSTPKHWFEFEREADINLQDLPKYFRTWPLPNVWLGTSIEAPNVLSRADDLERCPAFVRFWSVEPQIADLGDVRPWLGRGAVHWVICGGESGHRKRPFNVDWARSLRDQCASAQVPFFMKQVDKVEPIPSDLMIRQFPGEVSP